MEKAHKRVPIALEGHRVESSIIQAFSRRFCPLHRGRSTGGSTAASGAVAALWRYAEALGLGFPFDESGVRGWHSDPRGHSVQPRIPLEVAQLVHFDYHANTLHEPLRHPHVRISVVLSFGNGEICSYTEVPSVERMQACMAYALRPG